MGLYQVTSNQLISLIAKGYKEKMIILAYKEFPLICEGLRLFKIFQV